MSRSLPRPEPRSSAETAGGTAEPSGLGKALTELEQPVLASPSQPSEPEPLRAEPSPELKPQPSDVAWRHELIRWRAALCDELLQITSNFRTHELRALNDNLTRSIRVIDLGPHRALVPTAIRAGEMFALATSRLGELMKASGYDPAQHWYGSLREVEKRIAEHPEPELCTYCNRAPCVGPEHVAYVGLHWHDPREVAKRDERATLEMYESLRRARRGEPQW